MSASATSGDAKLGTPQPAGAAPNAMGPMAGAAATLVASALWFAGLDFDPIGLALVTLAAAAAAGGFFLGRGRGRRQEASPVIKPGWDPDRLTRLALGLGLAGGLACHLLYPPGVMLVPAHPVPFRIMAGMAAGLVATYLWPGTPPLLARWRFPILLATFASMAAVVFRASPSPGIDVWLYQQGGAAALLRGQNPYQLTFPNLYGHEAYFGPGWLERGRLMVYPYPPLTALLGAPAFAIAGDVRWLHLAAVLLAAWAIRRLGRGGAAEVAALLVLFQPGTFVVLQLAWTEPLVIAAWAATLVLVARWSRSPPSGWIAAGTAGGMLLSAKQYAPLLALPVLLAAPRAGKARAVALAAAIAAAIALPFVLWDPAEFYRDVLAAQFRQPFRMDSLSWPAASVRLFGVAPSTAVAFLLAGLALLLGTVRPRSLGSAAAAAALAFLLLVLFNKQAFFNYYWLSVGLLACASAASFWLPAGGAGSTEAEEDG